MTKIYICGTDTHVSPYETGDPETVTAEVLAQKRAEYAVWLAEQPTVSETPVYSAGTLEGMSNGELAAILDGYGISGSMTTANMVRLILDAQGGEDA